MASGFTMVPYKCPRDYPKGGKGPKAATGSKEISDTGNDTYKPK